MGNLADPEGRRRRDRISRRHSIESAAWRLFRSIGYQGTTVDLIAAEAKISQRTFFRYFSSKEALLFGDWQGQLTHLAHRIEKADPSATPLEAVRSAVLSLADAVERERDLVVLRSSLAHMSPLVGGYYRTTIQPAWEQAAAEAISQRLGVETDSDLAPRTIANAAMGALNAAMAVWVSGGCSGLLPEITAQALQVLEHLDTVGSKDGAVALA